MRIANGRMALVGILSFLFVGCVHTTPTNQDIFYGTYLFVSPCQTVLKVMPETRPFIPEAAGALALGIVNAGIDWVGAALHRAAQDDIEKTTVSTNIISLSKLSKPKESEPRLSDLQNKNICLQVVRAQFKYAESPPTGKTYQNNFSVDPQKRKIAPLQVVEEGKEELFIEILPIVYEKVIAFTPLEVRYSGYTPGDHDSQKPRDLALFIGYASPDKDVSAGDFPGRLITFGTMDAKNNEQAVVRYVKDGGLSLLNQAQWLGLPDSTIDKPITLAANIIETRKANEFIKFLDKAFDSSKEDIKGKAALALSELEFFKNSKKIEEEKLASEKEKLGYETTYLEKMSVVNSKKETLAKLCTGNGNEQNSIYNAQKDLYVAQKEVNIAASQAGKSRPYPDSEIKEPTGTCPKKK